jgi:hypothetical protein
VRQEWARTDRPGTFIIHAPFPDPDDPESAGAGGGEQAAARAAAAMVRRMRDTHEPVYDAHLKAERPLQWRDVLVLARFRTDFALYERAFREAGIPFLPPGRGMLAASREVRDLVALLRWLAWPDDNVALATVLRSPIVRLDQGALQALLSQRGVMQKRDDGGWREPRALWQALRASTDPQVAAVATQLAEWRRKLDFETCHDLLRRIARDVDLPRRYQVALGEQARFNLERLYDLALGGDVLGTPTARRLADMIERAAARGTQEEAPLPSDGEGRVRFLTVHGAKGLEAPVVLLVDADHKSQRRTAQVCLDADARHPALLLATTARQRRGYEFPEGVSAPADPLAAAVRDAEGRDEAEQAHLLYVALTRARDSLHVLGGDRSGGAARASTAARCATFARRLSGPPPLSLPTGPSRRRPPMTTRCTAKAATARACPDPRANRTSRRRPPQPGSPPCGARGSRWCGRRPLPTTPATTDATTPIPRTRRRPRRAASMAQGRTTMRAKVRGRRRTPAPTCARRGSPPPVSCRPGSRPPNTATACTGCCRRPAWPASCRRDRPGARRSDGRVRGAAARPGLPSAGRCLRTERGPGHRTPHCSARRPVGGAAHHRCHRPPGCRSGWCRHRRLQDEPRRRRPCAARVAHRPLPPAAGRLPRGDDAAAPRTSGARLAVVHRPGPAARPAPARGHLTGAVAHKKAGDPCVEKGSPVARPPRLLLSGPAVCGRC